MTGNGPFNANTGGTSYGDSFLKLKLKGNGLAVEDYFTPCNQSLLDKTCGTEGRCDLDLGSAGPLLVGGTTGSDRLVGGGKDGNIYVVDTANMGHFTAPTGPVAMDCPNPNAVQAIMGPQSQFGGHPLQGADHELDVLVQLDAQIIGAADDVVTVDRGGKAFLLHFLADAPGFKALQSSGRTRATAVMKPANSSQA
jgi:hypothetical protein